MSSELTKRILFGVIAAPVAIAVLVFGGWPLAALIAVASAIGAWELFRIARASGAAPLDNIGIAAAGITPLIVHSARSEEHTSELQSRVDLRRVLFRSG